MFIFEKFWLRAYGFIFLFFFEKGLRERRNVCIFAAVYKMTTRGLNPE